MQLFQWEPEALVLGELPQDSYAPTGPNQVTSVLTLWQAPGGAQRFVIETAAQSPASFPTLLEVEAEQLASFKFQFVTYEPPTV